MAPSELDRLILAISEMDQQTLIAMASKNRSKKHSFKFYNSFKDHGEPEILKMIGQLNAMLISCIEKSLGNDINDNWASLNKEAVAELGQLIQAAVDIALTGFQLNYNPSGYLIQLAVLLNGIILQIPNSLDNLKNSIAHLCEKLSTLPAVTKGHFSLFNVLIYLLRRTLGKKALKADVKRIYNVRKYFEEIMLMKEANTIEIWELLKKCAASPLYVSMVEGQKIIALAMILDTDRIVEFHSVIKAEFDFCSLVTASNYGRVYFEAWSHCYKAQKQDKLNILEIACLQDYILMAIFNNKRQHLGLVRKFMNQFHIHKKDFEVAYMLYVLYQPLLWRYLRNPSGQIRACSAQLFMDIFPLEDPECRVVATDLELNDQLLMVKDLLTDEFPIVRVTTIVGLCIQMSVNWEVFPEEMLKTYFRVMVDDLSCDSSSSEVRCAVARGVKVLLENPLTLHTLQNILPKLSGLFHDMSENVRIAFCQLLLRVKRISAIKYFNIVPLDHLLARLEEDCHAVKKCISNLICNSYFPRNEDPTIWLGRCLQIMKPKTSAAARVFFSYAVAFIGVEQAVKFMILSIKAVHLYAKILNASNMKKAQANNKENRHNCNSSVPEDIIVGFEDLTSVCILMDCIAIMWLSLKSDVSKADHKIHLKMLVARAGKPLAELCLHYKNSPVWESMFYVSSFLPAQVVPSLASLCFFRLKNLSPDAPPSEYLILLECLCNQNQGLELLQLLKEWIEVGLEDSYVPPPVKKRKSVGKNGETVYFNVPKPYLANEMLNAMFSHRGMQKAILYHEEVLKEILYFIDHIKRKFEKNSVRTMAEKEAEFLRLLLFNIIRLSVFLHDERKIGGVEFVTELVQWTDKKLLKELKVSDKKKSIFTDLVSNYCKNLSQVLSDVTGLGFCDQDSNVYLNFIEKLLRTSYRDKYAVIAAKFLYKYAVSAQYVYLNDNESIMLQNLLDNVCKVLSCYNDEKFLHSLPENELKEIQFALSNVMQVVHNHVPLFSGPSLEVFKFILKSIIDGLIIEAKKRVKNLSDEPFAEISYPQQSAFFLSTMTQKQKLIPIYLKCFIDYFTNEIKENRDMAHWIACWVLINSLMGLKNLGRNVLKEINFLVISLEKTLHDVYPKKKGGDSINIPEKNKKSDEMLVFQKHCHGEFVKLKTLHISKCCHAKMTSLS